MLRDVLLLQRREIEQRLQEPYVERDVDVSRFASDLIKVIIGPRRAGKSFFAMHAARKLGRFGYVNFDDERLSDPVDTHELLACLDALYEKPKHLLLDEVQNLPRWELLVNRLQRQGYHLIVTGSNAHLLGAELATHLTGRHLQIVLLPFSFGEYVRSLGRELTEPETVQALNQYAETGGYPEPLLKRVSHREYLSTLVRSTLYKDVVVRHRIRSPQGLEDLARYLMSNIAQEYAGSSLKSVTRVGSVHTVEKYLGYLAEAFLFFPLRRFSFKVREQARANRKVYCTDNGLVTSSSFRFSPGLGKLYENLAGIALRKQELEGESEVFFWKGSRQEEVDFVVKRGLRVTQLLQVCLNVDDPKTKDREIRALLRASQELKCKDLLVLTESTEREEHVSWYGISGTVRFIPLWKWLTKAQ